MNPLACWYTADTLSVVLEDIARAHIAHAYDEAITAHDAGADDKRETDTTIADVLEDYEL